MDNGDAGDDAFTQRLKELVDRANADTEVRNMITFAGDVAAKEKQLKEALAKAEAEKAKAEAEIAQLQAEKLETARKMKAKNFTIEDIAELTGLDGETIEKL